MSDFRKIEFVPQNEILYHNGRNLELRNEFLKLGVLKRRDFIAICQRSNNYFREWEMAQTLQFFWVGNNHKEEVIDEVQKALEFYKSNLPQETEVKNLAQDGKY
jgi:hypothetical protein